MPTLPFKKFFKENSQMEYIAWPAIVKKRAKRTFVSHRSRARRFTPPSRLSARRARTANPIHRSRLSADPLPNPRAIKIRYGNRHESRIARVSRVPRPRPPPRAAPPIQIISLRAFAPSQRRRLAARASRVAAPRRARSHPIARVPSRPASPRLRAPRPRVAARRAKAKKYALGSWSP